MPELPEVETIRRSLLFLEGETICEVEVHRPKSIRGLSAEEFARKLEGRKLLELARRGKYLLWHFEGHLTMVIHLRMTGQLLWYLKDHPPDKHTAACWRFHNLKGQLRLVDMRTFATIDLVPTGSYGSISGLYNLGPEILSQEFSCSTIYEKLQKRRSSVKSALLDQRLLAGVGNIYADEALFRAKLNPLTPANQLTEADCQKLIAHLRAVLEDAIANHGTTFRNYVDGRGESGGFQNKLSVYGRKGEECPSCGTPIQRIVVVGRGSFFCPSCQGGEGS